jgi:hypothetical protein
LVDEDGRLSARLFRGAASMGIEYPKLVEEIIRMTSSEEAGK